MPHALEQQLEGRTFSVLEYLDLVNELLSPLRVFVEGEVTDLKILPQWVFFALKDAETGALLQCGLHSGVYRRIGVNLEEGMAVKVEGYGKIAPKSGRFGFWVSAIEPLGEGALRRAYELLVAKLRDEGLFARKRVLPSFISHIGVISSRNGVVVQDLCKNLDPLGIRIDFVHSGVEGADAAPQILAAIERFVEAKERPQVLVVIRGGGSLESLQGFNNEAVVRALYAAPMPVLVGIGHDVDAPIATMVADWSASTPTAVAHVINDSWAPLTERVPRIADRLVRGYRQALREAQHRTERASHNMQRSVSRLFVRFDRLSETVRRAWGVIPKRISEVRARAERLLESASSDLHRGCERVRARVTSAEKVLTVADPTRVLSRGYSISYGDRGTIIRSVRDCVEGGTMHTRVADGIVHSSIIGTDKA